MVAISLMQTIKTYPQTGWVRADMTISTESLQEINELRKHLAELEAYKAKIEKEKILNHSIEKLASLDETIEISGTAVYESWMTRERDEYSWKTKVTLQQIFGIISPEVMCSFVEETQVETHLTDILFNQTTEDNKWERKKSYTPQMDTNDFNTSCYARYGNDVGYSVD
jgi:hypothetical protein